ncbi:MAG: BLUF domain-containing protein [Rhodobacteraceae bacterium]|nr:BLUF domain-containing protein [Paracoccaceae bacterium]
MTELYTLCYKSLVSKDIPEAQVGSVIDSILEKSRHNNAFNGITGVLLYSDGLFFQVLEGTPADVGATYDRICSDNRHTDVEILAEAEVSRRTFSDVWMGFSDLTCFEGTSLRDTCQLMIGSKGLLNTDEMTTVLANVAGLLEHSEAA